MSSAQAANSRLRRNSNGPDLISQVSMGLFRRRRPFESWVRPELPTLYRVARRMAQTSEDAEDLVQKCLVRAFQAWSSFDGRHLRSWLIRILRNEALAERRGLRGNYQMVELMEEDGPVEEFWDQVLWRDQVGRILDKLCELPEDYRVAVQLVDVEELSYDEAACALDVPMGTLKSRLHRGREMLRCCLEPESGSEEVKQT